MKGTVGRSSSSSSILMRRPPKPSWVLPGQPRSDHPRPPSGADPEIGSCDCLVWGRPRHRCRSCWRRWAYRRSRKLAPLLAEVTAPTTWHHVVLHLRFQATKAERSRMLSSLLTSLRRKYRHVTYVRIWHQTGEEV